MIPVDQTLFGSGTGNCFSACIASILELPLEAVPNFCADYPIGEHWDRLRKWLEQFGLDILGINAEPSGWGDHLPACHIMVCGPNSDGVPHAVVYYQGEMVHDPNPSRAGLVKEESVGVFVPRAPHLLCSKPIPTKAIRAYLQGLDR